MNWLKNANGTHTAKGKAGSYLLTLNPTSKNWDITLSGKKVDSVKGFTVARDLAELHDSKQSTKPASKPATAPVKPAQTSAPVKVTARVRVAPATAKEPVKATVKATASAPAKPASTGKTATATAPAKVKTPKLFTTYEQWVLTNPEPAKKRNEPADAYKKRLTAHKFTYGRAKMQYNRANGITATASTTTPAKGSQTQTTATGKSTQTAKVGTVKATAPAKVAKVAKVKEPGKSREELYGERWNTWPLLSVSAIELAIDQLANARASRNYAVTYGRAHGHTPVARDTYLASVRRCYQSEYRLAEILAEGEQTLPKGYKLTYEYLIAKGLTDTVSAPEGYSVLGSGWKYVEGSESGKGTQNVKVKGGTGYTFAFKPQRSAPALTVKIVPR
jgi:hypothetical protein